MECHFYPNFTYLKKGTYRIKVVGMECLKLHMHVIKKQEMEYLVLVTIIE